MPSEMDRRFGEVMGAITGPDGPIRVAPDAAGRAIVPGLPGTLGDFFRTFCAQHGDAEAIISGEERLTFADIDALSDRLAAALAGRWGIAPGDRVGLAMRNCPAWILCYMAIAKAGGIATLLNGWWTGEELAHGIALTKPRIVIADAERARRIAAAGHGEVVVELPIHAAIEAALAPLLADAGAGATLPEIMPDDDATILFTSGSTGRPKGAVATHRAVVTGTYTFLSITAAILHQFHGGDRASLPSAPAVLVAVPLFHVTGEVPVMLNSFALGRKMVLMGRWDAGEALRLIAREQVSYFVGVPTMSLEMMQHPARDSFDTSSLLDIVAGGAARPASHVPRLKAAFPASNPMMGYGLTETSAVGCTNIRGSYLAKPGSTGPAQAPFVEVCIFSATGEPVEAGAVGEIGIRSAANMRGYWNDPDATARAFTADGHFLTGDLGYLDADGYLFIVDRAKDIIIRGGENISCQEVEQALYAHPAIAEACVLGLPDERLGEVPVAVVHLRDHAALEPCALRDFAGERLAKFKLPTRIWFSDGPLPKLGTGKVDKKALRAVYGAVAAA
ncbi:class I adenylate-forming enzyme family protein [Sphingomonas profundi]|uniref:class I adenylate-forming enzyme family protein n=1 Tax=Alterirhizorhabdus profundi TaxID=2681549 RepID=UPI0012E77D3A|nr:class I adenylate-forming enzyme family protein [Sphingomonas profundi]